jgi:Fe-S-cluster containining protein
MILKRYKDFFSQTQEPDIDLRSKMLTDEAYQKIDCLSCGQCCRTTVTTFDDEDIAKASKSLNLSRKEFIKKYLILDLDGTYTTVAVPCPMLDLTSNKCIIYDARPKSCASFPHTQRVHFMRRKRAHLENSRFCPITQYVLDNLIDGKR